VPEHRHRLALPVRAALLALAAAAAMSAAGAGGVQVAQAQSQCSPLTQALSNGAPSVDGSLNLVVDGSGAFRGATFNPPGAGGPAETTNTSKVFVGAEQRFLEGECVFVESQSTTGVTTNFVLSSVSVRLVQTLAPISSRTSTLTQTYEITNTNPEEATLTFAVVRHVDGDLLFDGSESDGSAANADGSELEQFDAGDALPHETALAITGSLAGPVPGRWTIQPAPYTQAIEGAGGIPEADDGDTPGEAVDATLSQQWDVVELLPGRTATFTTVTRFGTPPTQHTLSVSKTGDGLVASTPAGISCGATCSAPFDEGTNVALSAAPDAGWTFAGWEGACTGTGACVVPMNGPRSVTAHFNPPPPAPAQNVNVAPVSGRVLVRVPGSDRFVELTATDQVPVGTQIDTTNGRIQLTAARTGGLLETSQFYEGLFTFLQANAAAFPEVRLDGGDFSCLEAAFSWQAKSKKPVRRVWGSGKGKYRTRGRYSSATVRGTVWKTEDRCDGTLTLVQEGVVAVRDFARQADIVIRSGQSYLAEPLTRGISSAGCTIIGTPRKDTLRGTPKRDVLCGMGGNDILLGLGGNDRLYGGAGNDWLDGGRGNDLLNGGPGRDRLDGNRGRDHLLGGGGRDFMISRDGWRGNDRVFGGGGIDRCRTDHVRICP
jgi:uncharacterized repeat protein (TIGR02543 family)